MAFSEVRSQRHALALIAAAACWGLGAVASKRAVAELAPTSLLVVQLAASITALSVVRRVVTPPTRARPSTRMLALGVLNPGLAYLLSLAGLTTITAGLSVLVWALEPVFIVVLAWIILRDRIGGTTGALMVVAVCGAALAGFSGAGGLDGRGMALTAAAVLCCAVYTVGASAWFASESNLDVVIGQQWYALGFAVLALGLTADPQVLVDLSGVGVTGWVSAVGSGVVYYGLAFWLYLTGLRQVRTSTAAISLSLIPVFGVAGGLVFLGERLTLLQAVGAGGVVAAVAAMGVNTTRMPSVGLGR
ncbi:MAG: DMT family transporter [Acidimicrobiia bacterium]